MQTLAMDYNTNSTMEILAGRTSIDNRTIVDIVASGEWVLPPHRDLKYELLMERRGNAAALNNLYRQQQVYISMTDAPKGGCEQDSSHNITTRVCLPEHPERSFWFEYVGNYLAASDKSWLHRGAPPSFDLLRGNGYFGVNDIDALRASFAYYKVHQLQLPTQDNVVKFLPSYVQREENAGPLAGFFNIPICYRKGGFKKVPHKRDLAIREPRRHHKKPEDHGLDPNAPYSFDDPGNIGNYPCECAAYTSEAQTTDDFLAATGLDKRTEFRDQCAGRVKAPPPPVKPKQKPVPKCKKTSHSTTHIAWCKMWNFKMIKCKDAKCNYERQQIIQENAMQVNEAALAGNAAATGGVTFPQ